MKIVMIGSGNLATQLSLALKDAGREIVQVYSRTGAHAQELAEQLGCDCTTAIEAIRKDADVYVFSVKDDAGKDGTLSFRVTSDPIRLPGSRTGYYACSRHGLLLAVTDNELRSGDLLELEADRIPEKRDEKSGALKFQVTPVKNDVIIEHD